MKIAYFATALVAVITQSDLLGGVRAINITSSNANQTDLAAEGCPSTSCGCYTPAPCCLTPTPCCTTPTPCKDAMDKLKAEEKKDDGCPKTDAVKLDEIDSYFVSASMEMNKPTDCDCAPCTSVKNMALKTLAENLKAKAEKHQADSEATKKNLDEVEKMI